MLKPWLNSEKEEWKHFTTIFYTCGLTVKERMHSVSLPKDITWPYWKQASETGFSKLENIKPKRSDFDLFHKTVCLDSWGKCKEEVAESAKDFHSRNWENSAFIWHVKTVSNRNKFLIHTSALVSSFNNIITFSCRWLVIVLVFPVID